METEDLQERVEQEMRKTRAAIAMWNVKIFPGISCK